MELCISPVYRDRLIQSTFLPSLIYQWVALEKHFAHLKMFPTAYGLVDSILNLLRGEEAEA